MLDVRRWLGGRHDFKSPILRFPEGNTLTSPLWVRASGCMMCTSAVRIRFSVRFYLFPYTLCVLCVFAYIVCCFEGGREARGNLAIRMDADNNERYAVSTRVEMQEFDAAAMHCYGEGDMSRIFVMQDVYVQDPNVESERKKLPRTQQLFRRRPAQWVESSSM